MGKYTEEYKGTIVRRMMPHGRETVTENVSAIDTADKKSGYIKTEEFNVPDDTNISVQPCATHTFILLNIL